jgi:hypothetical protein
MMFLLLFTSNPTFFPRVMALGVMMSSGLTTDCTSTGFSILADFPKLSVTVSFIVCFPISLNCTTTFLLFSSVSVMTLALGFENSHLYSKESCLLVTSMSVVALASRWNSDG